MSTKPLKVAITGNIGSGKTYISKLLANELCWDLYSADDHIAYLYEDENVKDVLFKRFQIKNKDEAREKIKNNELTPEQLSTCLFPFILSACVSPIQTNSFYEIPLLFEYELDPIFDYIIVVQADENIRKQRALNRGTEEEIFEKCNSIQIKNIKHMDNILYINNTFNHDVDISHIKQKFEVIE